MPLNTVVNMVTDEDLELQRMIDQRAAEQEIRQAASPAAPIVLRTEPLGDHLSDYVEDYVPAKTHATLQEQVFLAKANGADTIEAEDIVFKAIFGHVPDEPYAIYNGIKVYRIGQVEAGQSNDRMTMEQKLFGAKR